MSKAISSYPEHERGAVIARRIREEKGGLGYWAAKDAVEKKKGEQNAS